MYGPVLTFLAKRENVLLLLMKHETVIIEKSHNDDCDDILDGVVDGNDDVDGDVDEGRPPPPQFASDVCSPLQWEGKGALKGRIQEDGT